MSIEQLVMLAFFVIALLVQAAKQAAERRSDPQGRRQPRPQSPHTEPPSTWDAFEPQRPSPHTEPPSTWDAFEPQRPSPHTEPGPTRDVLQPPPRPKLGRMQDELEPHRELASPSVEPPPRRERRPAREFGRPGSLAEKARESRPVKPRELNRDPGGAARLELQMARRDPSRLRRAWILMEVLGPPRALDLARGRVRGSSADDTPGEP